MELHRNGIAHHQRQALDFMIGALGLEHARDEARRAGQLLELEEEVEALLSENRRLRLRVAELEGELNAIETELDAHYREIDSRIARKRERRLEDI